MPKTSAGGRRKKPVRPALVPRAPGMPVFVRTRGRTPGFRF